MFEILFSGCRSGKFPLEYARAHHGDRVTVHAYDAYQARKIREDVGVKSNVTVLCSDRLPDGACYDRAFYYATSKLVSAELELDTLQYIHIHLKDGAQLFTDGVPPETLGKLFGKVESSRDSRRSPVKCVCVKRGGLKRVRKFTASFEASVPGGPKLPFVSLPGCFCHRRPDEGGLALAEVVSAEQCLREELSASGVDSTTAQNNQRRSPFSVLDIGCGCGLVGLLVADALKRKGATDVSLALIDSHSRAIAAAKQNAAALGFDADCILSDNGLPPDYPNMGKFQIALANPPYYGDGRIADLFAEIAAASLATDGVCWMVAKTPAIIQEASGRYFNNVTAVKRRGYTVLRATGVAKSLA